MTTYEILSLLLTLSGGWIAFMSVSLSVIYFLITKGVTAPHRQKCGQLLLSSRPNAFFPNHLHRCMMRKIGHALSYSLLV